MSFNEPVRRQVYMWAKEILQKVLPFWDHRLKVTGYNRCHPGIGDIRSLCFLRIRVTIDCATHCVFYYHQPVNWKNLKPKKLVTSTIRTYWCQEIDFNLFAQRYGDSSLAHLMLKIYKIQTGKRDWIAVCLSTDHSPAGVKHFLCLLTPPPK